MTKKPTNSKRKRRSFWEPESPVLQKWIDDQKDLGTSLQLIIVDAIRNYGEGDAISAYLTARETAENEPVPMTPRKSPAKQAQAPQATPAAAAPVSRAVSSIEKKEETEEAVPQPVKTPIAPPVQQQAPQPEPATEPVRQAPPQPVAQSAPPVAAPEQSEDEEEYDPIKIMMQDVGSSYGG